VKPLEIAASSGLIAGCAGILMGLLAGQAGCPEPKGVRSPGAPPGDYAKPCTYSPKTQGERTWNDLVAACSLIGATLHHDITHDAGPLCVVGRERLEP